MTVEKLLRYIILAGLLYMLLMATIKMEKARQESEHYNNTAEAPHD
jgi:hypothetical protein